jgi:hypothetical protein
MSDWFLYVVGIEILSFVWLIVGLHVLFKISEGIFDKKYRWDRLSTAGVIAVLPFIM